MQLKHFFLFKQFDLIGDITHPYFEVHIICWIELGAIHSLRRNGVHLESSSKITVFLTGVEPSAVFTQSLFGTKYQNAAFGSVVVGIQVWVHVFCGLLHADVAPGDTVQLWLWQWSLCLDLVILNPNDSFSKPNDCVIPHTSELHATISQATTGTQY